LHTAPEERGAEVPVIGMLIFGFFLLFFLFLLLAVAGFVAATTFSLLGGARIRKLRDEDVDRIISRNGEFTIARPSKSPLD
jgi:hypothetical protein